MKKSQVDFNTFYLLFHELLTRFSTELLVQLHSSFNPVTLDKYKRNAFKLEENTVKTVETLIVNTDSGIILDLSIISLNVI